MPMFRFWSSDSRGSEKTVEANHSLSECSKTTAPGALGIPTPTSPVPARSPKRRRPSLVDTNSAYHDRFASAKRIKTEQDGGLPSPTSASPDADDASMSRMPSMSVDLERAKEVIQYQFSLEILLKHDELRLINQELGKCQTALEQLRRCHLIPYPVQCPTPSQMLEISSGKGPALQTRPGQPIPKWAPPFGVVEGPYARHYAKWLIPDPMFDGIQPEPHGPSEGVRTKSVVAEGRTTRNSMSDMGGSLGKQRPARGGAGQKLHALSSGYPQPKDKQAPCVVKRSDGLTVKLICIDCKRWDFSSTQGFINHCRIAHRRDFKSHEEAAVHCGHPIEVDEAGTIVGDENKSSSVSSSASGLVHPLARNEPISDQQAYVALRSRISASLELYHAGKLPNVKCIPSAPPPPSKASASLSASFIGSSEAPYLSQLMQKKKFGGDLSVQVNDAKTKVDWDQLSAAGEDSDVDQSNALDIVASPKKAAPPATARTPAVMRIPGFSSAVSPSPTNASRPASSSKKRAPPRLGGGAGAGFIAPPTTHIPSPPHELPETPLYDDDMDVDLSPNTITSNNAPSLVSDDGEYDDSDDGSASDTSEGTELDSVSDVAEINIEEDNDVVQDVTARPIHRRKGSASTAIKLKKEESRHVTFVAAPAPVAKTKKGTAAPKGRRKQQQKI
ncbi:protein AHC1 [Diplogelasinospora grovesii]|uniref:Protein AHC1 n=1 Tax=Diplogelasinospora grovesii TaxID=303347 RepID=A0AAN6MZL8_9PEZI|nr:protein AHC1 [Diplogelasinospora grovesii]